MTITLTVVFEAGREETIREFDDFEEAVEAALTLADKHGEDSGDGSGPPRSLRVYNDGRIMFSVSVMRGGLRPILPINRKVERR